MLSAPGESSNPLFCDFPISNRWAVLETREEDAGMQQFQPRATKNQQYTTSDWIKMTFQSNEDVITLAVPRDMRGIHKLQQPYFADLPCGNDCPAECEIRAKVIKLRDSLKPLVVDGSSILVNAFLTSYQKLCQSPDTRNTYPPDIALPALFDLVMSAKYAEKMVADGGWTYCIGQAGSLVQDEPALYFPFLKTCPRCSVKYGVIPNVKSNKPGSDTIGEIASDAALLSLSEVIRRIAPSVKIGKSKDRQGDVDAIIYDETMIALLEIKSSPLVIYPLEVRLSHPMTEVYEGISGPKHNHSVATASLDTYELSLYIPHIDLHIPLGKRYTENWPYAELAEFVSSPQNIVKIITLWKELYDLYAERGQRKPIDHRKWLMCGCGSPVDDSKNAPGMDRTDDLKKGTYQVLKYGTYYKEKCPRRRMRAVLSSNLLALRGFDRYLAEVQDVIWTKDKYSITLGDSATSSGIKAFHSNDIFNLYDALICLTRSIYRDEHLHEISSLEKFMNELCS